MAYLYQMSLVHTSQRMSNNVLHLWNEVGQEDDGFQKPHWVGNQGGVQMEQSCSPHFLINAKETVPGFAAVLKEFHYVRSILQDLLGAIPF